VSILLTLTPPVVCSRTLQLADTVQLDLLRKAYDRSGDPVLLPMRPGVRARML
jgi:hypothetical protein